MTGLRTATDASCSFCGGRSVRFLLQGFGACICERCALAAGALRPHAHAARRPRRRVRPTPQDIVSYMDERIVGQEHAKRVLAVAAHNHLKRLAWREVDPATEPAKSNVLLIGPSGSGKTLLMRTLAHALGLPIVVADATALTEAGYHGDGIEDLLYRLLQAADFDATLAQQGIVFIDEIDKIAHRPDSTGGRRDIGGQGVQHALLRVLEGAVVTVPIRSTHPRFRLDDAVDIDTRSILFVGGGAFVGLDSIVAARRCERRMGFGAPVGDGRLDTAPLLSDAGPDDLVAYGFAPEFVGRWPITAALGAPTEEELTRMLTEPKDALVRQYQHLFALDGIVLEFEAAALRVVARRAMRLGTGARGLRTILEGILLAPMFETLGRRGTAKVIVTGDAAAGLAPPLRLRDLGDAAPLAGLRRR